MAPHLKGKISLNSKEARDAVRKLERSVNKFKKNVGMPLLSIGKMAGLAAVAIGGLGLAAAKTSGDFDKLDLRLKTVLGSVEKANKAFAETFDLFVKSPMELEPLIEARILLEAFGVTGAAALKSVANAAAIMDRPVRDMASAIGSLETEPLRRLGIEAKKAGDSFTFKFLNKAGESMEILSDGIGDARKAVLSIMDIKFGGGLDALAKTWPGAMSTLSGAGKAAFADLGDAFKDDLLPNLMAFNDWIIKGISSGKFKAWGETFAAGVKPIVDGLRRIFIAMQNMTDGETEALKNAALTFTGITVAFKSGLLIPITRGLITLVTSFATASASVTGILAGLVAAIAGFKIGELIEAKFDISGMLAKNDIKKDLDEAQRQFDFLKSQAGKASGESQQMAWQGNYNEAKAKLEELRYTYEAISDMHAGARAKSISDHFIDNIKKDAKQFLPDTFENLFSAGEKLFGADLPSLPELTKSAEFAGSMQAASNYANNIASIMAPIRGFMTGGLSINHALGSKATGTEKRETDKSQTAKDQLSEQKKGNELLQEVVTSISSGNAASFIF